MWFKRFTDIITVKADKMNDEVNMSATTPVPVDVPRGISIASFLNPEPSTGQSHSLTLADLMNPTPDFVPWGPDLSAFAEMDVQGTGSDLDLREETEKEEQEEGGSGEEDESDLDGDDGGYIDDWIYKADGTRVEPAAPESKKRKKDFDDAPYESSDSDACDSGEEKKRRKTSSNPNGSKSARASLAKRKAFQAGTFVVSPMKLEQWKREVLRLDPYALFDSCNICKVRHKRCGCYHQVKEPLDLTRWRAHVK